MNHFFASRFGIVLIATLFSVAIAAAGLTTHSLTFVLSTACVGLFALVVCLAKNRPLNQETDTILSKEAPMISMVAFFDRLPFLDDAILSTHVNSAWGREIRNNQLAGSFVAGAAPLFVIKTEHQIYAVNYLNKNYFDNVDEVLEEVTELRLTSVIRSHLGWISVDLVSDSLGLDSDFHYARIGRLLRQLANEDCVALLLPDGMKLVPWDKSIEAALVSENLLENLTPSQPPVIPIDDNHPKLVAAVATARERFQQFVTAFENHQRDEDRDPNQQFVVKAPISVDGRTEFIWVTTTAIENEILYGTLDNKPVGLPGLSQGDRVRVPVSKLNDWLYTHNDTTFGGFTIKVISDWARSQASPQLR